jgi:glycosyltransferase involved in cell wall biosynthesis
MSLTRPDVHVCHVFPYPWYVSGGPTNGLRGHIRSQVAAGVSVMALSPGPDPVTVGITSPAGPGCDVTYVDFERDDLSEVVTRIRRQRGDEVLFHVNSVSDPALRLSRELRAQGSRYVHTSVGDLHFRSLPNFLKKFLFVNLLSRSVRGACGVHVMTQHEADRLRYLLPFWHRPTVVVPYVVEAPQPGDCESTMRRDVGIPDDAFLFLYLGRMDMRQKGLDILLRAFGALPDKLCWLAFVGPDRVGSRVGDMDRLRNLARSLNCVDRVRFVAPQEGERKWRALRMADAFVHPSRWDGFAISVAEALACGIPTIISNRMNIAPDLARHGAAAIAELSPRSLGERMRELMEVPQEREALGRRGSDWVETHCSSHSVGARFAAFYSMLLR